MPYVYGQAEGKKELDGFITRDLQIVLYQKVEFFPIIILVLLKLVLSEKELLKKDLKL